MIDPKNIRDRLDDYRSAEFPDDYICPNDCNWDTARDMLLMSDAILGLCGCGMDGDFDYVMGGLELLAEKAPSGPLGMASYEAHSKWYDDFCERRTAHFGSDISAQFFFKWADREGLAEHGTSVPGWLTDTGKRLLALMREAAKREPDTQEQA